MANLNIPLSSEFPSFDFNIDLDEVNYTLDFTFNQRANKWMLSIWDSDRDNLILGQIPCLVNTPLLYNFASSDLPPGSLIFIDETGKNKDPERDNLGTDLKLLYIEAL